MIYKLAQIKITITAIIIITLFYNCSGKGNSLNVSSDQIDKSLGNYYKHMGRSDYFNSQGIGKFKQFFTENKYKEENIDANLDNRATCYFIGFDDQFPYSSKGLSGLQKEQEVYNIFKQIQNYHNEIPSWLKDIDDNTTFGQNETLNTIDDNTTFGQNESTQTVDKTTLGQNEFDQTTYQPDASDQIDKSLGNYYEHTARTDYFNSQGIGKFKQFFTENQYEEDYIDDELESLDDCNLLDFDDNNFPHSRNGLNDKEKQQEIYDIIKLIREYHSNKQDNKRYPNWLCSNSEVSNDKKGSSNYFMAFFENNYRDLNSISNTYVFNKHRDNTRFFAHLQPGTGNQDSEIFFTLKFMELFPELKLDFGIFFAHAQKTRNEGHLEIIKKFGKSYRKDKDPFATNYNMRKYIENTDLGKALKEYYPSILDCFDEALSLIARRNIPTLNYNEALSNTICDNLESYIEIFISVNNAICKDCDLITSYHIRKYEENKNNILITRFFPIDIKNLIESYLSNIINRQIDMLIIPQATRASIKPGIFDMEEVYGKDYIQKEKPIIYKEMTKGGCTSAFWDLEKLLKDSGYTKKKLDIEPEKEEDYYTNKYNSAKDEESLPEFLKKFKYNCYYKGKYNSAENKESFSKFLRDKFIRKIKPDERYALVIDKRKPEDLKNMKFTEPNLFSHIPKQNYMKPNNNKNYNLKKSHTKPVFNLDIYLVKGSSQYFDLLPNQLSTLNSLAISNKFLLPNPYKREPDPIKILDALNGYKFAVSYQLFRGENTKCFWYLNQGVVYLDYESATNVVQGLWPRFFCKINDKEQTIPKNLLARLEKSLEPIYSFEYEDFARKNKYDYSSFGL